MIDSSYEFFTLKNISLHLLNLGAPPVSQEGEERKIYWIIQTNTLQMAKNARVKATIIKHKADPATYEVRVENRNHGRVKLIQKLSNYQGRNYAL